MSRGVARPKVAPLPSDGYVHVDPDERLGLRRMGRDELVELTRQGVLKTPKEQWDRSCTVLDVAGEAAVVRAETPWFVDFFHMGRFGDRWIIVNALWHARPRK